MSSKAEAFRTWPTEKLQEELVQTQTIIESPTYYGVNEHRYARVLSSEIDRRASLRSVTPAERVNMERRQIERVK
jgi:hypothetical protein